MPHLNVGPTYTQFTFGVVLANESPSLAPPASRRARAGAVELPEGCGVRWRIGRFGRVVQAPRGYSQCHRAEPVHAASRFGGALQLHTIGRLHSDGYEPVHAVCDRVPGNAIPPRRPFELEGASLQSPSRSV